MSQNQVVYKTGIYTEKELVESYGSPAQKNSFESLGWLQTKNKKTLLEKISRYCNITEVSKHIYEITEVYPYIVPVNFKKMNTSLYQYICPLILDKIINGHDKTRKIDITIGKWAREINMVNHNYNLCKYNKEDISRMTDYPINTVNEFYDKSDDMIEYYITNALDYLKSAGLIIWRDVYKVYYEQSNDKITIDSDGIVHANISLESREATQDDMDFYSACVEIADKEAKINNAKERYYSKKTKRFNEVLKRELYKRRIKYIYKTYEAYYIDLKKCQFVMDKFQSLNTDDIIQNFNKEFIEMIVGNANKRFQKNPMKYITYENKDDYSLCIKGLCEMTINSETEYLGQRIKEKKIEDNYSLQIE